MKKVITLILALVMIFETLLLTACVTPPPNEESGGEAGEESGTEGGNNEENNGTAVTDPDKYADFDLPREKLVAALEDATEKIDLMMLTFNGTSFPAHNSVNNVYSAVENNSGWNQGFWTGMLWHAYELTGEEKYKDAALEQIPTYTKRIDEKLGVDTHDMGFVYTPSCVAAYKITGDKEARDSAIKAADQLLSRYHEKGEFIQAWGAMGAKNNYRLIVDCLMNIPLLYWASETTGDSRYRDVAIKHFATTVTYAFRMDGSTYHTYFFDPETGAPLRGETHQGASDDSTWARGQAWAMYGPLLTYAYESDNIIALNSFKNTADYFLKYLPSDYVPYWDLSFGDGAYQPKDSSSAAIAVCALLEGAKSIDDEALRAKYVNAAKRIMNSLIESYTTKDIAEANGLLLHATYNKNSNTGVDEMNIWGDYFYMEALHRMLDPEWEMYW